MNTFYIPEDNMSRLEKQLGTIQKKCSSNEFSFTYNKIGEEYKTFDISPDEQVTIKYIVVEVEGTVKHDGWEFVATIDHANKAGNIIRAFNTELTIPAKYKTCGPTCEHCNKIRNRKDTYLIYNAESKEFKQVGKACMQEYTNGLDAEHVAALVSCYSKMEDMSWSIPSGSYTKYQNVEEILNYAFECYRHFGYEKAYYDEYETTYSKSTRERVSNYMQLDSGRISPSSDWGRAIKEEMDEVGFNHNSDYANQMTEGSLKWIAEQKDDNEYIRNLRIICTEPYTESRNFGILVSMPAAYGRYLDQKAYEGKKAQEHKEEAKSEYQGEVGDKLEIQCSSFKCISTFDNMYGTTWLYKFTDESGNIYTWFASSPVQDEDKVIAIKGTVKKHEEYKGVKQTIMTRCKVTERNEETAAPAAPQEDIFEVIDEVFYQ